MWQIIDSTNWVLSMDLLRIESNSVNWSFIWLAKFVEVCGFCQS